MKTVYYLQRTLQRESTIAALCQARLPREKVHFNAWCGSEGAFPALSATWEVQHRQIIYHIENGKRYSIYDIRSRRRPPPAPQPAFGCAGWRTQAFPLDTLIHGHFAAVGVTHFRSVSEPWQINYDKLGDLACHLLFLSRDGALRLLYRFWSFVLQIAYNMCEKRMFYENSGVQPRA
jgi:hypothetical protein